MLLPVLLATSLGLAALPVETLQSIRALPAHIAGRFAELAACEQARDGTLFVFDRRAHAVSTVPPSRDSARTIIQIGAEPGRILRPLAFDLAADGTFVVADAPFGQGRVQIFFETGASLGGFSLPTRELPLIILDGLVLNGVASLEYTGSAVLMSRPESGSLVNEYAVDGRTIRAFGALRPTGHEADRDVHLALNAGLVLANPAGGYFYVFVAGEPAFRKYDAKGNLVFERHIQGIELDEYIRTRPTSWPRWRTEDGLVVPLVRPAVRAGAVDADGRLWISLAEPYTYVYDADGD
ncbi:MAG TPA: hypothetical protein VD833_18450, partial [Vicinamibacterales bacterium]|nr:hypothetical protein [Vicinamibacterales bacterium]